MKNYLIGLLLLTTVVMTSCYERVEPGNEGIKVKMSGQNKGVQPIPVNTGRYNVGWYWEIFQYPTFTNIYPFTYGKDEGSEIDEAIRIQSFEGLVCNVDIAIACHTEPGRAPDVFTHYRHDMLYIIKTFCKQDLNTFFIEYSSQYKIDEIYSTRKMDMLKYVNQRMKEKYNPTGVIVEDVVYKSEIRLPESVAKGITEKVNANVLAIQKQNEIVQEQADAQKKIARAEGEAQSLLLVAKAQSEANRLLTISLSENLIRYRAYEKWKGDVPTYSGNGSVLPPLFTK